MRTKQVVAEHSQQIALEEMRAQLHRNCESGKPAGTAGSAAKAARSQVIGTHELSAGRDKVLHTDEIPPPHSITSSARASNEDGTARARALAVLKLIVNSNLLACTIGKSAGFSPLRMRAA